jgi:transposase
MCYVGIDWADQKHDVCIMAEDGQVLSEFEIDHNLKGFERLGKRLEALDDIRVNIERPDGLLVGWLAHRDYAIHVIPPNVLHHRRPRRSKDDRGDAFLLAHLLRIGDPECRPLNNQSDIIEELRQLLQAYDGILQEQRRLGNRLVALLKQYYPAALKAFCQPYRLIALAFIEKYPTPEAARTATPDDLAEFLRENNYSGRSRDQKMAELYEVLQMPEPQAAVQAGFVRHAQVLIPLLRSIYRSRYTLEKEIVDLAQTHPDAVWWQQFPGSQKLTMARLLAWVGDDRDRFPDVKVFQAVAGTVPVTRRSGKSKSVEFRTACSHKLRKAVDDFARQSKKKGGWARSYYNSQRARGHGAVRSYRALGNRWLSIIWKLWQSGESYDEQIHLANRANKGQQSSMQRAG